MLKYRTADLSDLPAMMKMVEEAKEGFRARNIDQWQKGEPNEQGLTEGIKKGVVHVLEENGKVLGMVTVVPGPEADYAAIGGAWLNDEPYLLSTESAYPRPTRAKGWLEAFSLILRSLQRKRVSETFVSTPIRTTFPCRKH